MPCLDTQNWNLTGLISAFLNLSVAYLLLCTSLFIHLVLRFLGFLGFSLPIFDNGSFGDLKTMKCFQVDLADCASNRISAVDRSIKSKIPFGSVTGDDDSNRFGVLKLVKDETEDVSREVNSTELGGLNLMAVPGMKCKRFGGRRSSNSFRNHKRGRVDCTSLRSVSSSDSFDETVKSPLLQPYEVNDEHVDSNSQSFDDTVKSPLLQPYDVFIRPKEVNDDLSNFPEFEKPVSVNEQVDSNSSAEQSSVRNGEEHSVSSLEESLREERAARAAVCDELDKERNAAASAADEAMAMIHRLQDEKAAIEMEAMQFQRVFEEKSTFDAEEMVILKDILLRREREIHFLEKEVEAYRQLLVDTEEIESSLTGEKNLPQNQESEEKRGLFVQELDGTLLEIPFREETDREYNRDLCKSDSEVAYSDAYMVKDEAENICKKNELEESSVTKPEDSIIVTGIARKLPPLCRPRRTSLCSSGSRRKSMSAIDYERLKIENEVELLRERLKAVQQERAELTRRASLPPLSSKVRATSEKRGLRRTSLDIPFS